MATNVVGFVVVIFILSGLTSSSGNEHFREEEFDIEGGLRVLSDFYQTSESEILLSMSEDIEEKENVQHFTKYNDVKTSSLPPQVRKLGLPILRRILLQGDILHSNQKQFLDLAMEKLTLTCKECEAAVLIVQGALNNPLGTSVISKIAVEICNLIKIEDKSVCELAVEEFKHEMFYVVFNLKPSELCFWLQPSLCSKPAGFLPDWNISMPQTPKPPLRPRTSPSPGAPVSKVLFFTDMHLDVRYKAGGNAECGEPLCCRDNDKPLQNSSQAAGKWGDYRNCDMPPWTVEGMMRNLSQYHFDFIIFTGDIPAHDVWNQSRSDQIERNNHFTELMLKYFPSTPVFAALGNHASSPVNSYPPPQVASETDGDISWLYNAVSNNWANWLDEDALSTVTKGGYYTSSIRKGLRVVSLNNNYCSDDDWWLLVGNNSIDPVDQLQWFAGVMQAAEDASEMVIILSHRPTDGCLAPWSRNYNNIINRYENIIISQFFGHAHTDELKLFFDAKNSSRVSSVGFIGPGYTTYSYLNAGYRIYTFDGDYSNSSHSLLDAVTYYLNITEANMLDIPVWRHEYSFIQDYGMTTLFPEDWGNLVKRFESDDNLFQRYYRHITKSEDMEYCSQSCKDNTIKNIKKSVAG